MHRTREDVDARGLRVHLDGELLAQLLLRHDLVLHLDPGQLREVGDHLLEDRVVGRQGGGHDDRLPLLLHPVEVRRLRPRWAGERARRDPQPHSEHLTARRRVPTLWHVPSLNSEPVQSRSEGPRTSSTAAQEHTPARRLGPGAPAGGARRLVAASSGG